MRKFYLFMPPNSLIRSKAGPCSPMYAGECGGGDEGVSVGICWYLLVSVGICWYLLVSVGVLLFLLLLFWLLFLLLLGSEEGGVGGWGGGGFHVCVGVQHEC